MPINRLLTWVRVSFNNFWYSWPILKCNNVFGKGERCVEYEMDFKIIKSNHLWDTLVILSQYIPKPKVMRKRQNSDTCPNNFMAIRVFWLDLILTLYNKMMREHGKMLVFKQKQSTHNFKAYFKNCQNNQIKVSNHLGFSL